MENDIIEDLTIAEASIKRACKALIHNQPLLASRLKGLRNEILDILNSIEG
ncbi:hypothetical protein Asulf_01501 [Archaeoglobus sulfaticallidus PM70-1]|uniref:Uncharacterized protein n=1 Tax=Archaeoglobus sulfaticallidus PM70-1 TaxID=387631 RepID=N0BCZ8_9EURY|nr:hypothetical protein [Archaeoglobus sulfaticallidus]AGK61484.1 hypothetical protein Asulf_01501 [Archaeoglobus sulfaticallidus PM70-1]